MRKGQSVRFAWCGRGEALVVATIALPRRIEVEKLDLMNMVPVALQVGKVN